MDLPSYVAGKAVTSRQQITVENPYSARYGDGASLGREEVEKQFSRRGCARNLSRRAALDLGASAKPAR